MQQRKSSRICLPLSFVFFFLLVLVADCCLQRRKGVVWTWALADASRLDVLSRRWASSDCDGGANPNVTFLRCDSRNDPSVSDPSLDLASEEAGDDSAVLSSDRKPNWMPSSSSPSVSISISEASGSWPRPESSSRLRSRASSSRFMLKCCITTRLTAMALSANADNSRALLFLVVREI